MARKSGSKKKSYTKVKPQNGFEDFEDYRDDDDDDLEGDYADENGYSTNSLRSQYVRPRDYRERRCYTLMNNCCWMICGILVALAIGAGGYAYMNGYIAVNVPGLNDGSSSGDGDGNGAPTQLPEGEDSTESNEAHGWFEDSPTKATSPPTEKPTEKPTLRSTPVPAFDVSSAKQDGVNEHEPGTKGGWFEDDPAEETPAEPVSSPATKKPSVQVTLHPPAKKETEAPSGMPIASGFETAAPTEVPTANPTAAIMTTVSPTNGATVVATEAGSTALPTPGATTAGPTQQATVQTTEASTTSSPTEAATTSFPTSVPTEAVTTGVPSLTPTVAATTSSPTEGPTAAPTAAPTISPAPTITPRGGWFEDEKPKATPAPKVTHTSSPTSSPLVDTNEDTPTTTTVATAQQLLPTEMAPYQYQPRRGIPLSGLEKSLLAQKWGSWTFTDKKKADRPETDYCGAFPNRDIPWDQFPDNAWQTDPDYLDDFLTQGKDLVLRAMEVHLAEYGFGPDDLPEESFLDRSYKSPFRMEIREKWDDPDLRRELSGGVDDYSGWMTQKSFDGLVRRLLHAVVSGDSFNLVMGGHSAAAGHGYVN